MTKEIIVTLDADENRVVWWVYEYDGDNVISRVPFRDKQDAENYAESLSGEIQRGYIATDRSYTYKWQTKWTITEKVK